MITNLLPLHNDAYTLVPNTTMVIQTTWDDDSIAISLYITAERKGYMGTLLKSTLTRTANALELNVDDFITETKNALCTPHGLQDFTYHLNNCVFKLCKSTSEGFRIKYGELHLTECPDAIEKILINSIKSNESKEKQIQALHLEMQKMNEKFEEMKMTLDKVVEEKVHMENRLLTKFAALLNAKKQKIVELEKTIKNRSSIADDNFESDGSWDSDPDYSSQAYVREKSPTSTISNQSAINNPFVAVVPKRHTIAITNETIVEGASGNVEEKKAESMDIYERDTEVLLDDM